ncbi:hypothetical protein [Eleftheria terrae]|uniref:hypothetical protein n=1 Tax=Eleftheria terrae TaxID=1597781 RepID=UPI00263A535B|nr:hypothetical protein [Eleftheria terrae]WKB55259.1 hypothetical protein N7L95_08535 [Eleftheria terrae]
MTPANRTQAMAPTRAIVERVEQRFGKRLPCLVNDTAYGTAGMLSWIVRQEGIARMGHASDKTQRQDGTQPVKESFGTQGPAGAPAPRQLPFAASTTSSRKTRYATVFRLIAASGNALISCPPALSEP